MALLCVTALSAVAEQEPPPRPATTQPASPGPSPPAASEFPQMPNIEALPTETTDSGLRYHDFEVGTGAEVNKNGFVEFRFTGWLEGGTFWQGTPATAPPRKLPVAGSGFEGWSEGVSGMKVGGRRLLIIPPGLAFGERGVPGVPPNTTIVMEVEIVDFIYQEIPPTQPEDEVETDSGLRFVDLVVGDGPSPEPGGRVIVKYVGWVNDGRMFSASALSGGPVTIDLTRVVPGWAEGAGSMKVGGKRKLIIPPALAYGDRGGRGIPPNATLTFEVELVDVLPAVVKRPGPTTTSRPVASTPARKNSTTKPKGPTKRFTGMPELP